MAGGKQTRVGLYDDINLALPPRRGAAMTLVDDL